MPQAATSDPRAIPRSYNFFLGVAGIQVATKATAPPAVVPGRRFLVPVDPKQVGMSTSNGRGYVLVSEATGAKVHVFSPDFDGRLTS